MKKRLQRLASGGAGFVGLVFLASRALYFASGEIFARLLRPSPGPADTRPAHHLVHNIWARWDGIWYSYIAAHGYERHVPPEAAFFPLPSLLAQVAVHISGARPALENLSVALTVISLAATLFGFYCLYRIAEDGWGEGVARRSVLALAFFPTSFFFNAAYSEGLFLALSAGALWAVRLRRNLLLGCILAALASATREAGLFLLIPLLGCWMGGRGWYGLRRLPYLALVPSGTAAYMLYLWRRYGDPLEFEVAEKTHWHRKFSGPYASFRDALMRAIRGWRWVVHPESLLYGRGSLLHSFLAANTFYFGFLVLTVVLLAAGILVLPWDLLLYSVCLTLLPALDGAAGMPLMSFSRFLLAPFPLFIVVGALLRSRAALFVWLCASAALSLFFCALFVSWRWVA
ncbi:hypothetical protein [Rubrobacter calidifluminis]|uniref:hypothetical protein n=1 Tax=Rubrobacter calidifluminis TaxID=1392640 RepID=UPI00235E9C05|nr:hypothetical protein [Rubrobacter calidifluminis]